MTQQPQQTPQLPSPKILLPVGIVLVLASVLMFVVFEVHVVSGIFAALIGIAGVAMTVQSIVRLAKGER